MILRVMAIKNTRMREKGTKNVRIASIQRHSQGNTEDCRGEGRQLQITRWAKKEEGY